MMDAYKRFKLEWMLAHGYTLEELMQELQGIQYEDPEDSDTISRPITELFEEWEQEVGFGSEIWPCYAEYLDCEAKEVKDSERCTAQEKELAYIIGFAVESSFDNELACQQLRSLWTAYCFHWGLDVDTASYDADLAAVWKEIAQTEEDTAYWSDFDSFDNFMCAELV